MTWLLNYRGEILLWASGVVAVGSIAAFVWRLARAMRTRRQFKKIHVPGIYAGERTNVANGSWLFEVLDIRPGLYHLRGRSVYVHREKENWSFKLNLYRSHVDVMFGQWSSKEDPANYGALLWKMHAPENGEARALRGCWTGTTRSGDIDFGKCALTQATRTDTRSVRATVRARRIEKSFRSVLERVSLADRVVKPSPILDSIIAKHQEVGNTTFTFNEHTYGVARHVFNPAFGKVSIPFIEQVLARDDLLQARSVLDWGTGCGFYAIEIALDPRFQGDGREIWALESSPDAEACTRANLSALNVSRVVKLRQADSPRVFRDGARPKQFDLILANLPFTDDRLGWKWRNTQMYRSFCAPPSFVLEMCVALRCHLSSHGKAILAYGNSGGVDWLSTCLRLCGLRRSPLVTIDHARGATDDEMHVFEIERENRRGALDDEVVPRLDVPSHQRAD